MPRGDELVAIIQSGDDELALPDHACAAELLTRIQRTRNPLGGQPSRAGGAPPNFVTPE